MKNYSRLISLAQNGVITAKDVTAAGIGRDYLRYAVCDGIIENVARGVYILKDELEDRLYIFQLKNRRLVFSANTSACLLGLTTRDSDVFFASAPLNYNNAKLRQSHCILREKESVYNLGQTEAETSFGNVVKIHNAERTVCDLFNPKYSVDKFVQVETLKNYLRSPDKNLVKLFGYAKQLNVYDDLKTRLEVLL